MNRTLLFTATLLVLSSSGIQTCAQDPVSPPAPAVQLRSGAELDQLVGAIALYPDPLIAQVLPAATLPAEVVLADRYVSGGGDPNLIDQQPWDSSVKALARYPSVLKMMDDYLAWTTDLGQAFLYQQQDVMISIQRLRAQASALGNLQSTPQETVVTDDGTIQILPAQPEVIYVPVYRPELVYFQRPFGDPFISFGFGFAIGGWLNCDFDWHRHYLYRWGHAQPRLVDWWTHHPNERPREEFSHTTVWEPRHGRDNVTTIRGDRGWSTQPVLPTTAIRSEPRPAQPREAPARVGQPAPVVVRPTNPAVISHPGTVAVQPPATGALIGVQNSHATEQFSNRGQQSRQPEVRPPAPPAHPAPPPHSPPPNRAPNAPTKH